MPYVAPSYGGVKAEVLLVLRDPGPMTQTSVGSGMLSAENDDPGAERAATLLDDVGLDQERVVSWNAHPWYINRKPTGPELDKGVDALVRLLELLPRLRVIMLLGGDAQAMWRRFQRAHPAMAARYRTIATYHTGNQAFIGSKEVRDVRLANLRAAFLEAANAVEGAGEARAVASSGAQRELVAPAATGGATAAGEFRLGSRVAEAVVRSATGTAESRWAAAQSRARTSAGTTADEKVAVMIRSFSAELAAVGASVGVGAAAPALGTALGVAASVTEAGYTARRLADLILTIAAIRGMSGEDVEERKAWVLSVMAFGNSASTGFSKLAGEMGKGLGKRATAKIPTEALRRINRAVGRTIITKYGTKRGVLAIGKVLPLGFGAAIGGSANYVLVRQVGRHADRFFKDIGARDD